MNGTIVAKNMAATFVKKSKDAPKNNKVLSPARHKTYAADSTVLDKSKDKREMVKPGDEEKSVTNLMDTAPIASASAGTSSPAPKPPALADTVAPAVMKKMIIPPSSGSSLGWKTFSFSETERFSILAS